MVGVSLQEVHTPAKVKSPNVRQPEATRHTRGDKSAPPASAILGLHCVGAERSQSAQHITIADPFSLTTTVSSGTSI